MSSIYCRAWWSAGPTKWVSFKYGRSIKTNHITAMHYLRVVSQLQSALHMNLDQLPVDFSCLSFCSWSRTQPAWPFKPSASTIFCSADFDNAWTGSDASFFFSASTAFWFFTSCSSCGSFSVIAAYSTARQSWQTWKQNVCRHCTGPRVTSRETRLLGSKVLKFRLSFCEVPSLSRVQSHV